RNETGAGSRKTRPYIFSTSSEIPPGCTVGYLVVEAEHEARDAATRLAQTAKQRPERPSRQVAMDRRRCWQARRYEEAACRIRGLGSAAAVLASAEVNCLKRGRGDVMGMISNHHYRCG